MTEPAGATRPERIGPYEILGVLGSGGMGVVYRACDTRLSREVAIKVIHRTSEGDPRWRQRFAAEARAAAALNHPNIVAVYDVAIDVEAPYIVAELIDGVSLREELRRGPLRLPRLLDLATQLADALTTAHQAHLIHRDLKPENVMLTKSGRVKIVDFGLAKETRQPVDGAASETMTAPHAIAGTAAYMSPEQARGDAIDFRSDLFSFGAMLYEMVTGRLAFDRPLSIDTLSAILHDEPRPISQLAQNVPFDLQRIIQRCLAKRPDDRYGSTADLLHDLRWLKDHPALTRTVPAGGDAPRRRTWVPALAAAAALGAFALGSILKSSSPAPAGTTDFPRWLRVTFDDGPVHTARFAPDGQTVLYSAAHAGQPVKVYSTTTVRSEWRALELPPAGLLAISRTGELAISLSCTYVPSTGTCPGTLARAPLLGGAPRSLAKDVRSADWGRDGQLAVVVGSRLEYPPGTPVAEQVGHVRVAPDNARLAWTQSRPDGLALIARNADTTQVLSEGWAFIRGLAWAADSRALFVTGMHGDLNPREQDVFRIGLDRSIRPVLRASSIVRVLDAASDNRLLVALDDDSARAWRAPTDSSERRDLSWLGTGVVDALSHDGRLLMLTRRAPAWTSLRETERQLYSVYVRPTVGGPPTFLGGGIGLALSSDAQWALTVTLDGPESAFVVYPLGPGPTRTLDRAGLIVNGAQNASFVSPDLILFDARRNDSSWQTFTQAVDGGSPALVVHERGRVVSPIAPDGRRFVSQRSDGSLWLATLDPTEAVRLPFSLAETQFIRQWTDDGREVYVLTIGTDRDVIEKIDLRTGRVTPHLELKRDPATRQFRSASRISRDGRTLMYTEVRYNSTLYLIDGIK